jgi:hypothetical protein
MSCPIPRQAPSYRCQKKTNFSEQSLVAEAHDGTIVNRKFSWNTSKCGIYRSFSSSRIPLRMSSGHFHSVCSRIGLGLSCRLLGFLTCNCGAVAAEAAVSADSGAVDVAFADGATMIAALREES